MIVVVLIACGKTSRLWQLRWSAAAFGRLVASWPMH